MSIDTIQLPGHLCQIMYRNSLIEASKSVEKKAHKLQPEIIKNDIIEPESIKEIPAKTITNSLGENKGNILFLVNNDQNKFLADDEMKLLSDLLTACKISMADIALVNYHQHSELNYQELSHQFQPKKILIFGVTASELELPFAIPFFQIQKFQEQLYMVSPSLSDFLNNKELKMLLWNSLKKIFLLTN
jgi:DNA polymerase III psi subunit